MLLQQSKPIKNWMETMGFELVKSDFFNDNLFNYYHLGNFGVCEEIQSSEETINSDDLKQIKFISWNLWGEDFEVNCVNELSKAYQDSITNNPEIAF